MRKPGSYCFLPAKHLHIRTTACVLPCACRYDGPQAERMPTLYMTIKILFAPLKESNPVIYIHKLTWFT